MDASLIGSPRSMGSLGPANGRRSEYVRIPEEVEVASKGEGDAAAAVKVAAAAECPRVLRCRAIWWWAKVIVLGIVLARAGAVAVVFLGPLLIKKVVSPILYWESTTFSGPAIALICFGAIALFPSVLLPSSPFMWLAGMTFGYLYGFLIITVGMSIGMSLPYFIGSAFHCRIHRWLEKWPKKVAFVRENSLFDTRKMSRSFLGPEIFFVPYLTLTSTFIPNLTLPSNPLANGVN